MTSPSGRDVVLIEAVRTPVGRGDPERGYYKDMHAADLLAASYSELVRRSGIEPGAIDLAVAGCVHQIGEQAANVARNAWLQAGLPAATSALTVDMQCGSSQQGLGVAAALIAAGVHDVAVAAGVEHMGHLSFDAYRETWERLGSPFSPRYLATYDRIGQGLAAEMIADAWELSRAELDEFAVRSHTLAHRATADGRFAREMVAVEIGGRAIGADQGIRADTRLEVLSELKPVFKPDGKITAASASQISDGSAAVLLATAAKARELGLVPRARVVDQTSVGCDPVMMLEGPIPATARILERNGMSIDDIDRFEVNEAFASVVLAWAREHDPDMTRVNTRGGAIALGHPLGSTGVRLMTTLLHTLEDDDAELGLVTMCCGGGIGTATLIQRV